jgi:hypothetical protein
VTCRLTRRPVSSVEHGANTLLMWQPFIQPFAHDAPGYHSSSASSFGEYSIGSRLTHGQQRYGAGDFSLMASLNSARLASRSLAITSRAWNLVANSSVRAEAVFCRGPHSGFDMLCLAAIT